LKKTIYITLLLILFLQFGGLLIVLNIQQQFVKHQMKEKLENDFTLFEKLTLTKEQYQKSKIESREIFFNGNMYDIKSEITVGDSVKLIVINDVKEKNILKKMMDLSNNMTSHNSKFPNHLNTLIWLKYLSPEKEFTFFNPVFKIKIGYGQVPDIISQILDISTPPPRKV